MMKKFHPMINQVFRPLRKLQAVTIVFSVGVLLFKFMLYMEIQKTVDSISWNDLGVTMGYLKGCALLIVLFFGANCMMQYFFRSLQYTSHYALVGRLFGLALEKDCSFHEKNAPPVVLGMIKDDSKFISDWKSIGTITVFFNSMTLAAVLGILIRYHALIALFILLAVMLCFFLTYRISKEIGKQTYDLQVANSEANQQIIDDLNGFRDIRQYRKESFFSGRLAEFLKRHALGHSRRLSGYYAIFTSVYAMLTTTLPVLVILAGVVLILRGQYTIGELLATFALVGNLQEPVMALSDFVNQRKQALAMQDKLMPILERESADYSVKEAGTLQNFVFHSDGFCFEDGKKILEGLDFEFARGERVVIKGESGKGKSSLLNLVSRFRSAKGQAVRMSYNGTAVEDIEPGTYYGHVLQAQQTPRLFRDTLQNNITLGEEYPKEAFDEAVFAACLDDLIRVKGADYLLEANGENVSGGQRQRIGLARILLRKPDIMMLDEPTSALDPELAGLVAKRVTAYCEQNRIAVLLVSHNDSFERYGAGPGETGVQTVEIGK